MPNGSDDDTLEKTAERAPDVHIVGTIDKKIFEGEFGKLQTDEVVLTNEREKHIKSHHSDDYALFEKYGKVVIEEPDVVLRDRKNEGTAFMVKRLPNTNLNVILRLALETDSAGVKNSVMTFYRIRNQNLEKLIFRNKMLYKTE